MSAAAGPAPRWHSAAPAARLAAARGWCARARSKGGLRGIGLAGVPHCFTPSCNFLRRRRRRLLLGAEKRLSGPPAPASPDLDPGRDRSSGGRGAPLRFGACRGWAGGHPHRSGGCDHPADRADLTLGSPGGRRARAPPPRRAEPSVGKVAAGAPLVWLAGGLAWARLPSFPCSLLSSPAFGWLLTSPSTRKSGPLPTS